MSRAKYTASKHHTVSVGTRGPVKAKEMVWGDYAVVTDGEFAGEVVVKLHHTLGWMHATGINAERGDQFVILLSTLTRLDFADFDLNVRILQPGESFTLTVGS